MPEILAILIGIAIFVFAVTAYSRESARQDAKLSADMRQYWAVRRLHEGREIAAKLKEQRRWRRAESFYRTHGYYPSEKPMQTQGGDHDGTFIGR